MFSVNKSKYVISKEKAQRNRIKPLEYDIIKETYLESAYELSTG